MLLRLAVVAAVACAVLAARDDAKPDCRQAGDGYYTKGCSTKFWRCVNDRLYSYDCPRGLYFNPLKRKCEYKDDVAICNQGSVTHSFYWEDRGAEFNCTSLPDGPYKPRDIACSNTFITCFNGMAVEQACPFGQFFHETNRVCDYKDNVPGCLQTKGSKIGGSIAVSCPLLRSGHVDIPCDGDEFCQQIDAPVDGRYLCTAPFSVWYGPTGSDSSEWILAPEGLRCGSDGRWYDGNTIVSTAAVDCTAKKSSLSSPPAPPQSDNAKGAARNACPGLLTGKVSEGIPCDADEMCQAIQRPKNGRYSCSAPFSVWYGPVKGASSQWKEAKEGLTCGSDGFWYDGGVKVEGNGIDCSATRTQLSMADDDTHGCPSLSTNEREIPCKGDQEVCQPILKAVAGKYACPTPYRVWYGPRGGDESSWKQAQDALICKDGSWFDGDVKIDASAVDCTVKKIDCSKLEDGAYNGEPGKCSTHFWQCSNAQAYLYPCAPGLFFDDFSKTCEYKEAVESCGGTRRSPSEVATTAAPPAADAASEWKTPCPSLLTEASLPCKSGDACAAPADPVNQKYLCDTPYTLYFGPKSNADQWRQAPNGIQCKNGHWFNGDEQIAPEAVHCTTPKFDCVGKEDKSYSAHPEKCTAYFWKCAHDDSFLYTCPHGLFFDVDTLSCDYKEVIVACGGMKKDAKPTDVVTPSSDASSLPSFDCSGKENGYHETGKCEKKFWNCADGKPFQIDCPEGLVYDGRVQLCQYPLACSGELPSTTTPATPPSTLDHGDMSKKDVGPTTSFDCTGKADGQYAEKKCHKQYVECTNGRTFAKECPAGLVYVPLTTSCDYKQVCMNPPTTLAPSTTPAADPVSTTYSSYATYERIPATTKAPLVAPSFDKPNCANLENGAHSMARCGQEFFLCWNGETSLSKCSDGLVFNAVSAQCDYRSNVIECGAAADATTAKPGEAAPPSPPVASPAPDLFCEGREDGHFGSGCQSYFYSCQSGVTLKMFCPVGLFYDADSKTCDMREIIVACGGKKER
ncbi:hypothetical protein PMAYCL1PPCAC_02248 [Pristionchus mayeri]|uniref:Chitin-binding type-2 domain-containing protein n=1 Tax=Pristionchus mayeri TaxID=1317129 RepID=A0AAN4Z511_9BILA|nr:hypothetical protein PMAYCL1PPCAC_02248 [Pristionchus mayeri]